MILVKLKPVVVEAIEWTGKNEKELEEQFGIVVSLDSLPIGSYIVKDERNRLKVFTHDQFYKLYERHLTWEDNI